MSTNAQAVASIPVGTHLRSRILYRLLASLRDGRLEVHTPEGDTLFFGGHAPGPEARLEIRDWSAVPAMLRKSDIGIAECWRDGLIATPDMTAFLKLCIANQKQLEGVFYGNPVVAFLMRMAHALRPNTRKGARKNIHAHYDLGNAFYGLWLDETMTYSSALFEGEAGRSLARAQEAKYERLLETLEVEAGHHVLEVGCGWGGFAEYAARTRGCRVTGITISRAQLAFARERIARAGLDALVDLQFCDYRDLEGRFDRVVSIEMFEAVGERFWKTYFRAIHDRLVPGGRAAIQSIVIAGDAFDRYRSTSDFIREYIFPGGMLPSVSRFVEEARKARLSAGEPLLFAGDYAETLRLWRHEIAIREPEIRALGFDDRFLSLWRFYLHYCEAGFDTGRIDVMQVQLVRA